MNERIRELFGQALDQAVPETWTTLNPTQLSKLKEKFAELIVRDCCDFIEAGHHSMVDRLSLSTYIKKHFGVEE